MSTIPSKQALVTGAAGFIGSHLVDLLLREGWAVRALCRYNSRASRGWLDDIQPAAEGRLDVVFGDVRDPFQMASAVQGCDAVFHLAALIGIPYSYVAPQSYIDTNVSGTLNLLEAVRQRGVPRFVHTSTSEVYGTAQYTPIDEKHPLQGQSPYSASKIAADKLVESYFCAFGMPTITVRPFNTFGPRQSTRAVIPTIITQALAGPEIKLGSLDPVRDLTYVTDTARGFLAAAEAPATALGQVYNLGTGQGVSIGALAQVILALMGKEARLVTDDVRVRPQKSEVRTLLSNNASARDALGWTPQVSLRDGLKSVIEWIGAHQDAYRAGEYTL
jgi:NAD dependent epimerase/dehydratase